MVGVDTGKPCNALLAFAFEEAARRGLRSEDSRAARNECEGCSGGRPGTLAGGVPGRRAVTSRARVGHAATELVDRSSEAGLVVVGRRIRQSSIGAHIGPVAHAVLHHAKGPVAVIAHE
ncbi:universal stress protein [Streptomyces sp. NBC_01006]|uniref:universal stress protein n=1 Tax=Streptomyces sp. NBC_01006 TaxID=2903716 RepID=UPI00386E0388